MKRRDNLKSKLGDSQAAPKFDCEDRKKENGYDYFRQKKDDLFGNGEISEVDNQQRFRMGLGCRRFRFVGCTIEFDMAINERIPTCHYLIQSENYKISCVGSFDFYNPKR